MLIYTAFILSYGYRRGHEDGLEFAKLLEQDAEEDKAESEDKA